jgi:hypothetical protein
MTHVPYSITRIKDTHHDTNGIGVEDLMTVLQPLSSVLVVRTGLGQGHIHKNKRRKLAIKRHPWISPENRRHLGGRKVFL